MTAGKNHKIFFIHYYIKSLIQQLENSIDYNMCRKEGREERKIESEGVKEERNEVERATEIQWKYSGVLRCPPLPWTTTITFINSLTCLFSKSEFLV